MVAQAKFTSFPTAFITILNGNARALGREAISFAGRGESL
jgi:hypothetical protein